MPRGRNVRYDNRLSRLGRAPYSPTRTTESLSTTPSTTLSEVAFCTRTRSVDPALGERVPLGADLDRTGRGDQRDLLATANHHVGNEHVYGQRSAGRQRALQVDGPAGSRRPARNSQRCRACAAFPARRRSSRHVRVARAPGAARARELRLRQQTGTYRVHVFAAGQRTPTVTRSPRFVALCSNACSGCVHDSTRRRESSLAALTNCFTWLSGRRARTNASAAVCTSSIDCVVANAVVANKALIKSTSCRTSLFTSGDDDDAIALTAP